MSEAWELARFSVGKAQSRQKQYYDQRKQLPTFGVGDRAFLFKPAEKTGEARKLARPYYRPFGVVEIDTNTAKIRRLDRLQEEPILIALDRLRKCPAEIPDECWPPNKNTRKKRSRALRHSTTPENECNSSNAGTASTSIPDTETLGLESLFKEMPGQKPEKSTGHTLLTARDSQAPKPVDGKTLPSTQFGHTRGSGAGGKWAGRLRRSKKMDEDVHTSKGGDVVLPYTRNLLRIFLSIIMSCIIMSSYVTFGYIRSSFASEFARSESVSVCHASGEL